MKIWSIGTGELAPVNFPFVTGKARHFSLLPQSDRNLHLVNSLFRIFFSSAMFIPVLSHGWSTYAVSCLSIFLGFLIYFTVVVELVGLSCLYRQTIVIVLDMDLRVSNICSTFLQNFRWNYALTEIDSREQCFKYIYIRQHKLSVLKESIAIFSIKIFQTKNNNKDKRDRESIMWYYHEINLIIRKYR